MGVPTFPPNSSRAKFPIGPYRAGEAKKIPFYTACRHPFPSALPLLRLSFIPNCLLFISFLSALVFCQRPFFLFLSLSIFFSSFVSGVCVLYILSPCDPGLSLSSVSLSRVDLVAVAQSLSSISVPSFVTLISFGFISFRTYRLSMLALGST